jgi:ATP-dependent exoDNAse (exonuclease V) beta subunit
LYDFFAESDATETDWEACTTADAEDFDDRSHAILQIELKSLYVGVTRAKERVYIWDRSDSGLTMEVRGCEYMRC